MLGLATIGYLALISTASALESGTSSHSRSLRSEAKPGDFDLYVLAQSWQPQFCQIGAYPGCDAPEDHWKTHFTIHGLWPEYNNGYYPEYCTNEWFDATPMVRAIGMVDLLTYWPNVKEDNRSTRYDKFWQHEWKRHGTCSGLNQLEYFQSSIALIKSVNGGTPSLIQTNVGKAIDTADIRKAFGGNDQVVLRCDGDVLSEVYTCWSKNSTTHVPTTKQACPRGILAQDSCYRKRTKIQAFAP